METRLILERQDLTWLSWSKIRNSSGTAGSFLKAYSELGGRKTYYKLSDYDNIKGVIGHECVNELVVDRLLTLLGIEHLHYQLIHAEVLINGRTEDVYLCASEDFKEKGEDKTALDDYFEAECEPGESRLDFCIRQGWEEHIYQMLVVDFLILNRDRHGGNIEVLRNKKNKTIHLAPLFDHGLSLLCTCKTEEAIDGFGVMEDRQIQSYIGSRSARDNLDLIPHDKLPMLTPLRAADKALLMDGLDGVISRKRQEKMWDMIWKRWCWYEAFCHSG